MVRSGGRYDEELQTLRFVQESIDKIAFDRLVELRTAWRSGSGGAAGS